MCTSKYLMIQTQMTRINQNFRIKKMGQSEYTGPNHKIGSTFCHLAIRPEYRSSRSIRWQSLRVPIKSSRNIILFIIISISNFEIEYVFTSFSLCGFFSKYRLPFPNFEISRVFSVILKELRNCFKINVWNFKIHEWDWVMRVF